ncbi:MAG TPA: hypothetical protein VI685_06850 [Candidatus Angelobacter sp.]
MLIELQGGLSPSREPSASYKAEHRIDNIEARRKHPRSSPATLPGNFNNRRDRA